MAEPGRILVIRHGALGDIVQSFGPFAAIRAHHPGAWIGLLTTAPFAGWLARAPWFDAVAVDARPGLWQWAGLAALRRQLRGFDRVYDLQTSGRSTRYFWLAGCPPWSGVGAFRRLAHRDPERDRVHTRERQLGQLRDAGIGAFPAPATGWLMDGEGLERPGGAYAVLVPGASAHRPEKRWPGERFGALAGVLAGRGLTPVVAGAAADRDLARVIGAACPDAVDLTGRTDLFQLGALLGGAALVVGNDTGPMHLAAALGRRCVVLFGGASDPALTAPRGPAGAPAVIVRAPDLADLPVGRVAAALG